MTKKKGKAEEPAKELTVVERATLALGLDKIEERLVELAESSKAITEITNKAGYDQCHATRMSLKNQRVEIERRGKLARDDANKFARAVIAEEARLIALIEPEEKRLQALQKAHDDAVEAERQARVKAEMERVGAIRSRIDAIRNWPVSATGKPSSLVEQMLRDAEGYAIDDTFEEFREEAERAIVDARASLTTILGAARASEAEKARIAAEREELERLRAEQAERDRIAQQERERLAAEEARIKAEREALEAEKAKAAQPAEPIVAAVTMDATSPAVPPGNVLDESAPPPTVSVIAPRKVPSVTEILDVLVDHFGAERAEVVGWLRGMFGAKAA